MLAFGAFTETWLSNFLERQISTKVIIMVGNVLFYVKVSHEKHIWKVIWRK